MNKILRNVFTVLLVAVIGIVLASCGKKDNPTETKTPTSEATSTPTPTETVEKDLANCKVYFHYQRPLMDYENWNIWVWQKDGVRYAWEGSDSFGVYFVIDLSDETLDSAHAPQLGYIFHRGNWEEKDTEADRFVDFTEDMLDNKNEIHIYSKQGDTNIYLDAELTNMVCKVTAFTLSAKLDQVTISCNCRAKKYVIYEDGVSKKEGTPANAEFTVSIKSLNFDYINHSYKVEVSFANGVTLSKDLNFNALYDSTTFASSYTYTGDDLGVTLAASQTTFKLWAPISSNVTVQLWSYGHTTNYGTTQYPGDNTPVKEYTLVKGEQGVWSLTVNENLKGYYYTYSVTNGSTTTENIVDPYAKAAGLNGMRGYIADFNDLNPTNWQYGYDRPYSRTELAVYELHVRDLTMDSTWTGTEANRGKYLGMCETGTTYTKGGTTVTTGFDHIKELGVNAVQILPFFDQSNDERSNEFNWGYNPQNYNVLEGQYSSDPYNAETRIKEFKTMMMAYQNAGIEVIMDVVYNHMNGISGSSFDKIVPGYYFRYNTDGSASNGSGCGNETASERSMVSKFIVDSTKFWTTEYNISGFRFDLMGLHDISTMSKVATTLHEIDEDIVVYGEPWTGGTSRLDTSKQAITANVKKFSGFGMFDDTIRDKIKGSVFNQDEGYWLQGEVDQAGFYNDMFGIGQNADNALKPGTLVSYVSCHDNNTLRDKLILTGVSEDDLANADIVGNAMVFGSQGVSFFLSGEEMLRSKKIYDASGKWTGEYSHNSYNLPDSTNALRWDEKVDNLDVFNAYKTLIAIKTTHPLFQLDSYATAKADCSVILNNNGILALQYADDTLTNETWAKAVLIYTNANGNGSVTLPEGNWSVAFANGATTLTAGATATGSVTVGKYTVVVLYQAK